MTGEVVVATMPGKCATPPAPAMIVFRPRSRRTGCSSSAPGCGEQKQSSFRTARQLAEHVGGGCMTRRSESLPIMMPTWAVSSSVVWSVNWLCSSDIKVRPYSVYFLKASSTVAATTVTSPRCDRGNSGFSPDHHPHGRIILRLISAFHHGVAIKSLGTVD